MKNEKPPKLSRNEKMKELMTLREKIIRIEADAEARAATNAVEEYFNNKEKDLNK